MPIHEYRILEKMAVGSFGMVFRVQRILDDAILVMKRIPLEDLDADQRHEAAQEMCLMTELHHPYIVTQRDAFLFNENDLCLIMDYYDGGDLEPFVIEQRDKDEYFPFQQVMLWFTQMVLATHYLHSHDIVHRDLKTRNLFVDGKTNGIAVGDFGIAEKIDTSKIATWRNLNNTRSQRLSSAQLEGALHSPPASAIRRWSSPSIPQVPSQNAIPRSLYYSGECDPDGSLSHSHLRRTPEGSPIRYDRIPVSNQSPLNPFYLQSPQQLNQAMRGTPLYMAPEALQGGHVGPKADVWSLGCILYELLALRHPFETRDIGGLVMRVTQGLREPLPSHYPAAVHELMDAMLAVDARGRPSCEAILHTPLLKAYVELLQLVRVPSSTPQDTTEVALAAQLKALGETLDPSARHVLSSRDDDGSDRSQHAPVLAYTKIERDLPPPLNPPSVEHRLARLRQAEATAAAGTMYASASAESSVSSSAFPMGAGTFFTVGVPLLATPSPERHSRSTSRLSTDPSSGGGGGGSGGLLGPPAMVPTASMRPFMIYDHPGADGYGNQPSRKNSNMAGLAVSAAAAAAAAAVSSQSPLLPPPRTRMRARPSRDFARDADADRFFAEYANVVDMRDKPTDAIVQEVDALRDAVQQVLRRRKQHGDGAALQRRYGNQVTDSMPETTGTVPGTATSSSAGSPPGASLVGGTRVYYNNLFSCLMHQQKTLPAAARMLREGLAGAQFHDSMPVSARAPSITPAALPATSDGVHGRDPGSARSPASARQGRLGAVQARPVIPNGERPESGYLRRALFDDGEDDGDARQPQDSLRKLLALDTADAGPGASQLQLPDLTQGPPVVGAGGSVLSTKRLSDLWAPQAYAQRRRNLVRDVSTVLEDPVWQAVYWYYRDTHVLQRDPRTVLGWVPDRSRWKVLPLIEDLVVLDRFLMSETASSAQTTRTA